MALTASLAAELIDVARKKATQEGFPPVNISVCDAAAHLVAFLRMDGAVLGTIDVAHRKARSAALFRGHGAELSGVAHPGGSSYMVEHSNGGLIFLEGGVVLNDHNGDVLGAIGVSGASAAEDEVIARAAAETLGVRHRAA